MKTVSISYHEKNYKVNISFLEAWPDGFYKIDWEDKDLLKLYSSPVYISKSANRLVIPPVKTLNEVTFLMSLISAIFFHFETTT
jgi:hypothetical protein